MGTPASRLTRATDGLAANGRGEPPVRGILFELGNVLYDATAWRRWLWQLVSRLGVAMPYGEFSAIWDQQFLPSVHCGRRDHDEALQAFLQSLHLSWAQIDEIEAASRIRRVELDLSLRALPGVAPTIATLASAGVILAVLTDAPHSAAELRSVLERAGVAACFRAVVSSLDLEAVKPDPKCYQAALEAIDLPAAAVALVAPDTASLNGAAAAGLRTVAVNFEPGARADAYLDQFSELPDLLQQWAIAASAA